MKKKISFLIAVICAFLCISISYMLFDIHFLEYEMFDSDIVWMDAISAICMFVLLAIIHVCNRFFDASKTCYVKPLLFDRWCQNTVFISCVTIAISFFTYYRNAYAFSPRNTPFYALMQSFALGVIVCAVVMYVRSYNAKLTREKRIKQCMPKKKTFTLLVEEISEEGEWIHIKGNVNGVVRRKDDFFLYASNGKLNIVPNFKIYQNGIHKTCVKDEDIEIVFLKKYVLHSLQKYCVASNVLGVVKLKGENHIDSPIMNALLLGYRKHYNDVTFMKQLLQTISKSQFLLGANAIDDLHLEIIETLRQNAKLSFPSILADANDKPLHLLPVFTDWQAMYQWEALMKSKNAVSMIYPYEEVYNIMKQGFDGIVLNPYGPASFVIPYDLATDILRMMKKV